MINPIKEKTFEKNQVVTCNHTFQVKIIKIHEDEGSIEFIFLDTGKRGILPISGLKMIAQILH